MNFNTSIFNFHFFLLNFNPSILHKFEISQVSRQTTFLIFHFNIQTFYQRPAFLLFYDCEWLQSWQREENSNEFISITIISIHLINNDSRNFWIYAQCHTTSNYNQINHQSWHIISRRKRKNLVITIFQQQERQQQLTKNILVEAPIDPTPLTSIRFHLSTEVVFVFRLSHVNHQFRSFYQSFMVAWRGCVMLKYYLILLQMINLIPRSENLI